MRRSVVEPMTNPKCEALLFGAYRERRTNDLCLRKANYTLDFFYVF